MDENSNKVRKIVLAPLDISQSSIAQEQYWALASLVRSRLDEQLFYGATANQVAVFSRTGAEVYGYMEGGNDRNSWATGVDYAYLYTRLTTDSVASGVASASSSRFINVSGVITQSGGIHLNPFLIAESLPYTFVRPTGTHFFLQFLGSGGTVLDAVGFDLDFTREVRGVSRQAVEAVPFSFAVPLPDSVASLSILSGTTPMTTYMVSPQPPTVTVLAPNGG